MRVSSGTPRVSICIPVFNCERFLREAICSALGQTYSQFELIILDNASTDGTAEVLADFDDPRITVHRNETNIGAAGNWNRAVELASGEYIKLLCADDVLEPECLARQIAALDAAPSASLCSCRRTIVDEEGAAQMTRGWGGADRVVSSAEALREIVRTGTNLLGDPSAVLFRRDASVRAGEFRAEAGYAIDLDLWIRLLEVGDVAVIVAPLTRYRVSASSWSVSVDSSQAADAIAVLETAAALPGSTASSTDLRLGVARARLNQVLRWVFYKVVFSFKSTARKA